jgi:hypothetical protein
LLESCLLNEAFEACVVEDVVYQIFLSRYLSWSCQVVGTATEASERLDSELKRVYSPHSSLLACLRPGYPAAPLSEPQFNKAALPRKYLH